MATPALTIGTRGSRLALVQAETVRAALAAAHPGLGPIAVQVIRTTGDAVQDRTLSEIGGKGLFTREIDEALLDGRIDLAVHSMKDVPTRLAPGIALAAVLEREDPRDALLCDGPPSLAALAPGTVVGSASLRRAAQVLMRRPDVTVVPLRGNVDTRIAKLEAGQVGATLLAVAGLKRLGLHDLAARALAAEDMLPAVAQGALGVAVRENDAQTRTRVAVLDHVPSACAVAAERAFLAALDGSCRTPIAGLARLAAGRLAFEGLVVAPDGRAHRRVVREGAPADAERLGADAGAEVRRTAGPGFFAAE